MNNNTPPATASRTRKVFSSLAVKLAPRSIAAQLDTIMIIAISAMVALGALSIFTFISLETSFEKITLSYTQGQRTDSLLRLISKTSEGLDKIIDEGDISVIGETLAQNETMMAAFAAYKSSAQQFNLRQDLAFAIENEPAFLAVRDVTFESISLFKSGELNQARTVKERIDKTMLYLLQFIELDAKQRQFAIADQLAEITALRQRLFFLQIGVFAAGALLVFGIGFGTARSISKRLADLTAVTIQIAAGDLTIQAQVEIEDEIGTLASAFNTMATQLRNLIDTLKERTQALETSIEISRQISTILDLDQLLQSVVDLVQTEFKFYHTQIYIIADCQLMTVRELNGLG
jgi:nitrogen fixation/metabolism regulation signal transduction histidine kinase